MVTPKQKSFLAKAFSLFSVVRGYNVLTIVIAQYLASIYILAPNRALRNVLFDVNLLMLVLASSAVIAAGYIINNFQSKREKFAAVRCSATLKDRFLEQSHPAFSKTVTKNLFTVNNSYKKIPHQQPQMASLQQPQLSISKATTSTSQSQKRITRAYSRLEKDGKKLKKIH